MPATPCETSTQFKLAQPDTPTETKLEPKHSEPLKTNTQHLILKTKAFATLWQQFRPLTFCETSLQTTRATHSRPSYSHFLALLRSEIELVF